MPSPHKRLIIHKGRGALSNPDVRYKPYMTGALDDGWDNLESDPPLPETKVYMDNTKTIITRNDSPDVPVEQSINIYRGCSHGCIYCFARPTHAYINLSPGLDFETKLLVKPDAPELLRKELNKKNYQCKPLSIGTNTDMYQPIEKEYRLTRQVLEVLLAARHPVSIITKSSLIERDIDILSEMAKYNLAQVFISVTTLDNTLWRKLEPRTAAPIKRLKTIARLSQAGIPTGVLAAPLIPFLNDMEMEKILDESVNAGAKWGMYQMLRLPMEVRGLFGEWIEYHYPLKAKHVMNLFMEVHGGSEYNSQFGSRMSGKGHYADMMRKRFSIAVRRLKLNQTHHHLNTSLFAPPDFAGKQMGLF